MSQPGIPTIDVAEAERRLREDPAGPLLLDVRETNEFAEVRAPARCSSRRRRSWPGSRAARRIGRCWSSATWADGRRPWPATCPGRAGPTSSTWPAAWKPGSAPACRSGAGRSSRARETARRLTLAARSAVEDARDDRPGLRLVGERPADQQQDDEVHGPDAGRVQIAELLADLALDLEAGDGRADQAELEERALRRGVGADARWRPRRPAVVPPTRIASGPEMTAGAPSARLGQVARRRGASTPGCRRSSSGPPSRARSWGPAVIAADEVERAVGAPAGCVGSRRRQVRRRR